MTQVSLNRNKEASSKVITRLERVPVANKVIAFRELVNLKCTKRSEREAARLLEVPNSTMRSWRKQYDSPDHPKGLEDFINSPSGAAFLQRNTIAVMKLMKAGPSGIRGMKEYLRNSGLDKFVASSEGALQNFWERCETHIIGFAEHEEKRLQIGMRHRKVTVGMDEMFKRGRPCLVAIEVVSNYILLEKFTEDRTAKTWKKEIEGRLTDFNIEVGQVVSDLCGAIRSCARDMNAEHIPELFHAQQEISKGTSAALASQRRSAEKALKTAEDKAQALKSKPRRITKKESREQKKAIREAEETVDRLKVDFEEKSTREKEVKEARKETSKIIHPINLKTGLLQSEEEISVRLSRQFEVILSRAIDAKLSCSSLDRIEKAKRAFDDIVKYLKFYFIFFAVFLGEMELDSEMETFFIETIFPLVYLHKIWDRMSKAEREEIYPMLEALKTKSRDGPWPEELKQKWKQKAQELVEVFQRSSSCVEGRNGVLSLNHHRFHRLNKRSLKVLTIIHNFDVRRSDGTTAAERLFEAKHEDLFESMVTNIRIPGRPQKQLHERKSRIAA